MAITRINNNLSAYTVHNNIDKTSKNLSKSIERLSSGLRINRSADDAAGMNMANRLKAQSQGLGAAIANAQDGMNLINMAEGALDETTNRLNRIRLLSLQASNSSTNDYKARSAIQDEIYQNIDEITRIANTTQFGSNYLLNGNVSIKTGLKAGQKEYGVQIDPSPVASTLNTGTSFLHLQQIEKGYVQINSGENTGLPQILNTGIRNQSDIAVSLAFFGTATGIDKPALAGGTALSTNFFNGVSIQGASGNTFIFEGILADGVTKFTGSFSLSGSNTFSSLVSQINVSIDNAEKALFGKNNVNSVPSAYRTTAIIGTGSNAGRIVLGSSGDFINQASIDFTMVRGGITVTRSTGVVRSNALGINSAITGVGQVGNSVTAITGSTFNDGQFTITVTDIQQSQQRTVENTIVFRNGNGSVISRTASLLASSMSNSIVLNGTFVSGNYTGGISLFTGDTITLKGITADGTTFQSTYTYEASDKTVDTALNDFKFQSISGLIREMNYRTRDYSPGVSIKDGIQTRFEDALFTFTSGGNIQLIDDYGRSNSQTGFTLTFQNRAANPKINFTLQDAAELRKEGYAEQATLQIGGGKAVRAEAGQVVTLKGPDSTLEGVPSPQVTFRLGNGLTAGKDNLQNKASIYAGNLNGGQTVTFSAGDQQVVFNSPGLVSEPSKFVTVNFDSIINVTSSGNITDTGAAVLLSTMNSSLNFQIGAYTGQSIKFSIGDLKSDNLGFGRGSKRTMMDINVTTLTGAQEALRITDAALDQINRTRSILGAATNRLESTIANLSVASQNITASESHIRDADIAVESTKYTQNQVLLQAGVSVLAQANFQSKGFLTLFE